MLFGDARKSKFKSSFKKIKKCLKPYIHNEKCDVEIASALIVAYDFAVCNVGGNRRRMANVIVPLATELARTNANCLQKRMDFYGEFVRGKQPRCDFCFGRDEDINHPLFRVIMALGDVIYDPDLMDNYEGGAVLIGDVFENRKYATKMKKVTRVITAAFRNAARHKW